MKIKNALYNKIIISGYLLPYLLCLGLTAKDRNFHLLLFFLLPAFYLICFWRTKKPMTFLVFNIVIFGSANLIFENADLITGNILANFALSLTSMESAFFFKNYFFSLSLFLFYLPTALFASLINLGIQKKEKWIVTSSLILVCTIGLIHLSYIHVFIGDVSDIVVVFVFHISVLMILIGGTISSKLRNHFIIFDQYKNPEQAII